MGSRDTQPLPRSAFAHLQASHSQWQAERESRPPSRAWHEDNARIRFLSADEEENLRKAIEKRCPERMPEFDLALNTGVRLSEQYGLLWENVSIPLQTLTIPRSKNGSMRHVPLNQGAIKALETLRKQHPASEFVCGGAKEPRPWFEPVLADAKALNFSWHCLRHTFASRLVMAGVDIRTVQELLGHKAIGMTVRYSHLAPKHTLAAVERLDAPSETPTDTTTDTRPPMQIDRANRSIAV